MFIHSCFYLHSTEMLRCESHIHVLTVNPEADHLQVG